MERLTYKRHDSDVYTIGCSKSCRGGDCGDCEEFGKIIERLAAYEDTGLTPESVEALKLSMIGKAISEITEFEGLPIDRLKELAKADKEGRLVVLPEVRYCERYGWENITWDEKYGIRAGSWNTREEAEEALRRAENG